MEKQKRLVLEWETFSSDANHEYGVAVFRQPTTSADFAVLLLFDLHKQRDELDAAIRVLKRIHCG